MIYIKLRLKWLLELQYSGIFIYRYYPLDIYQRYKTHKRQNQNIKSMDSCSSSKLKIQNQRRCHQDIEQGQYKIHCTDIMQSYYRLNNFMPFRNIANILYYISHISWRHYQQKFHSNNLTHRDRFPLLKSKQLCNSGRKIDQNKLSITAHSYYRH